MKEKWFELPIATEKAIKDQKPVVALESTLIAQGLPFPKNVEVAMQMEEKVRESGAIPATIGFLDGICKIGMSREEIERLGNGKEEVIKVGEGEIPYAVGMGLNASTTVSGTAWIADKFDIKVFATGGIGGVHRGVNDTYDVSQDLNTMTKTQIIIVSSGAKSILDIPKTLERLETNSILIMGYQTNDFPAFYSRMSGNRLNYRAENPQDVAMAYKAKTLLKSRQAILVANPVPGKDEIPNEEIDTIISDALEEALKKGITGKEMTPFLLENIAKRSNNKSMATNISLLLNNAKTAGEIAVSVSGVLNKSINHRIGFQEE